MRMVDPLLPVIAAEFGITLGRASLIIAAYSLPYGIFVLLYGPLGDRIGKLKVIIGSMAVSSVCIVMCGFADSERSLALWRFLTGLSGAAAVPLSLAFIGDVVALAERQRALARYMSGVILGQIMGSGLGGIIADYTGWRTLFLIYGAISAITTLSVWLIARRQAVPQSTASMRGAYARYVGALREPSGRAVMAAVFIEGILVFGGSAFLGAMLHDVYRFSLTRVGLLLMCVGLGSLAYSASVGWLIRHVGQRRMMALGGVLMAVSFVLLPRASSVRLAVALLVLLGFAVYLMHNTLQMLATELIPEARGTAVSLMAFMLFAGQAAGAYALGHSIDTLGYARCYGATGIALVLLGAWLYHARALPHPPR